MNTKSIILSSNGLKNINLNSYSEGNDFCFILGNHKIHMPNFFADFISPIVAKYHYSDPVLSSIYFKDYYKQNKDSISNIFEENVTDDIIYLLKQLATGHSIEINEQQSVKLRHLSFIFGNTELFNKIDELFPLFDENAELLLQNSLSLFHFSNLNKDFDFHRVISTLSSNFYRLNRTELVKLPKTILLSIISNDRLIIESEDSLFDIIIQSFQNDLSKESFDDVGIIDFFEQVDFVNLSDEKLREFIEKFDFNCMTQTLWRNLSKFIVSTSVCRKSFANTSSLSNSKPQRYFVQVSHFEFDGSPQNAFNGIIHHLTEKCGGNVNDKCVVKITASSFNGFDYEPKKAADLDDTKSYFQAKKASSSWLKYDFIDKKVAPINYSIRSRNDHLSGNPANFVIEGSNDPEGNEWKLLDAQNGIRYLDELGSVHTFEVERKCGAGEGFRFLRLRQTGLNTGGQGSFMSLSALEFFGDLF